MPARCVFTLTNNYFQGDAQGICTVASMQWAKKCLERGRGLGSFQELALDSHQMNALMAVWRNQDGNPTAQTEGMGMRIVGGADRPVNQMIDVQSVTNLTWPNICIFWNSHHTMGYRVSTAHGREVEFFDMENGLWLADNDSDIRQKVIDVFAAGHYADISGMRVLQL